MKTLVPGGQCYAGDQSGADDGGEELLVIEKRIGRVRREVLQ